MIVASLLFYSKFQGREKKKTLVFAFLSRVMQSSGMLFLETTATAELCNVAE